MPRFSANLSLLYSEQDFMARFAAARQDGFAAVELHFPYAHERAELAGALRREALEIVLFNLPPGDWAAGERGIACHPQRVQEFQDGIALAIDYARALGCPRLNCLAGLRQPGVSETRMRETLIENLRFAAFTLKHAGIELVMEPINSRDMPGFFINTTRQALDIIDAVGSDNLRLQYDIYHAQVMEGDLARTLEDHLARIGHIQLADNPGRHEPGTGEINFPFLLRHLDRLGYPGWVGCEYRPLTTTTAGLGWLRELQS
ncbi:MAG: hydroxypyruvate isomerase [Rhodocyclaceae bacterium]|nr:MAG: hydroxypyruvate isomerase [Rhodocyclaceae bacterium]